MLHCCVLRLCHQKLIINMGNLSEMQRYLDESSRIKMVQLNDAEVHHLPEMRRHPRHFVQQELFPDGDLLDFSNSHF